MPNWKRLILPNNSCFCVYFFLSSGDIRNDLYLMLERGDFERGGKSVQKNIEVTMYVLYADGEILKVRKTVLLKETFAKMLPSFTRPYAVPMLYNGENIKAFHCMIIKIKITQNPQKQKLRVWDDTRE